MKPSNTVPPRYFGVQWKKLRVRRTAQIRLVGQLFEFPSLEVRERWCRECPKTAEKREPLEALLPVSVPAPTPAKGVVLEPSCRQKGGLITRLLGKIQGGEGVLGDWFDTGASR